MFDPQDFYFKKAKKEGYKARSIFKLEDIDKKFNLIAKRKKINILDIGCAPGSWLQYLDKVSGKGSKIIGFDLKKSDINTEKVFTYVQDATKLDKVEKILQDHKIDKFDLITSDMAPNTIGFKDIDGLRSMELIKSTLPIYDKYLKEDGKFVIKIFMGPGYDEFVKSLKQKYGGRKIKTFKPDSVRKISKEIYIIKI